VKNGKSKVPLDEVVKLIILKPSLTVAELAVAFAMAKNTAESYVKKAEKDNSVERVIGKNPEPTRFYPSRGFPSTLELPRGSHSSN